MSDSRTNENEIRQIVSTRYGQIAQSGGASCCGGSAVGLLEHAEAIGYRSEDLATLPEGANLGLGCGNPTSLTMITEGMTVLDLGSGAGVDCFLASPKVGQTGRVIGVDMTEEMLDKARAYAEQHGYENVEFRAGEIESIPVNDESVDLAISNCVINLSPDKPKVFGELSRILRSGGRAAISDIVLLKPLPSAILEDIEAYIGCIAGAVMLNDYLAMALAAGLDIERAERKAYDVMAVLGCSPEAGKLLEKLPKDLDANAHVASLDLVLVKPSDTCCDPSTGCC